MQHLNRPINNYMYLSYYEMENVTPSKSIIFFRSLNRIACLAGQPNLWITDFSSKLLVKIHTNYLRVTNILIGVFIVMEWFSVFTQNNLSPKQKSDLLLFGTSHPVYFMFILIFSYRKEELRMLIYNLTVTLKRLHNDVEVEKQMIRKAKMNAAAYAYLLIMAMVFYGFDALMKVINEGSSFTIVITAWPLTEDKSVVAEVARVMFVVVWWVFILRVYSIYLVMMPLITSLSHQFKNIQSFFYRISQVFEEDLGQTEKDDKFMKSFKYGIKLHMDTLGCTRQCQATCGLIFSGQIVINVTALVFLMSQMMNSDRTLENTLVIMSTSSALLLSTGFFMWTAGDVTVEASLVVTAMYHSGWERCQGSAALTIGKLLIVAMNQAQRPVRLKGLGLVELSHQSYLTIVKSSYSVFSVLY